LLQRSIFLIIARTLVFETTRLHHIKSIPILAAFHGRQCKEMTIPHYEEHHCRGTLVMAFCIAKSSPSLGTSSFIVDPLAVAQGSNMLLGQNNLLLFDG
jgi:hypothetical protein